MTTNSFVVLDAKGAFWDGQEWTQEVALAKQFHNSPDAYADAALAASCLRRLGHVCNVAYLGLGKRVVRPATKIDGGEVPGARPV